MVSEQWSAQNVEGTGPCFDFKYYIGVCQNFESGITECVAGAQPIFTKTLATVTLRKQNMPTFQSVVSAIHVRLVLQKETNYAHNYVISSETVILNTYAP